jgi:GNAT superfamily N-acetyltransferase
VNLDFILMETPMNAENLMRRLERHASYSPSERQARLSTVLSDPNVHPLIDACDHNFGVIEVQVYDDFVAGSARQILVDVDNTPQALDRAHTEMADLFKRFKAEQVRLVMSVCAREAAHIHALFDHFDLKPWYGYVFMQHDGSPARAWPGPKRIIEAQDYARYIEVMGTCFEPMRQANDIPPYNVQALLWRDESHKQSTFEAWMAGAETTWMYERDDHWVGSGLLRDADVDDVFVLPQFQNQGYGRAIVEDLIYEAQQRSIRPYIGHVTWNETAAQLYRSLNFIPYLNVLHRRRYL